MYQINRKEFITSATNHLGHSQFIVKNINQNCSHIITASVEDHAKIRELLKTNNTKFFYYTPKEEKPINILIRGIDSSYDEADIEEALKESNINMEIFKVIPFSTPNSRRNNHRLNIWMVKFKPGSDLSGIMKIKSLLNQRITLEKPKSTEIVQCKRCQRYGHIAFNCVLDYRCVKCAQNHEPGECRTKIQYDSTQNEQGEDQTRITSNAHCVNCGNDGHPANYRNCPAYKKILKSKKERLQQQKQQQKFKINSINNIVNSKVSYAKVLKQNHYNHANVNTNSFSSVAINPQLADSETPQSRRDSNIQIPETSNHMAIHNSDGINTTKHKQSGSSFTFLQGECMNMFGMTFIELIRKINSFLPKYRTILNYSEKSEALLSFMFQIMISN